MISNLLMSTDERFVLMRNYDMFSCITDEEYEELDLIHNFLETPKGDYIYFDSHCLDKLFFLKGGYIKIGYIDDNGNEIIKEIINEGEVFGQFTLEKNNLNGEFALAHKSDVSLCAFKIDDFERLLKKKPELAIEYSKKVGKKLRKTEFRLVNMLNKDVRSRLLGFFYHVTLQDGYDGTSVSHSIDNFLTHDDIARLIGSARQTVTTSINQLEEEGHIKITRQEIHIPDVKALQNLVIVT
jgi:CRP/FNR family transcriptional regulator, cyclic AMP receptor protein